MLPDFCDCYITHFSICNFDQCCYIYQVIEAAREKFNQEISFQSKDKDISLAKVILFPLLSFRFEPMCIGWIIIAHFPVRSIKRRIYLNVSSFKAILLLFDTGLALQLDYTQFVASRNRDCIAFFSIFQL